MDTFDLRLFRKSITKLSQEEFAKKIGFSKGTIGKIEAGYASITDNILDKIEEAFGKDFSEYKSYGPNRYKDNRSNRGGVVSEQMTNYHYEHNNLVNLLRDYSEKLEQAHKDKETLLLRISELEKELLLAKTKQ